MSSQIPATDIFVATLSTREGRLSAGPARNLTSRDGYDNQPAWSLDGRWLYFTSGRDGQFDIYRTELATGRSERVTTTDAESEYSATFMHGGTAISVIRVERDSTQRLWRVPLDGSPSTVILERVKPVGYHAWADSVTLALFVLGSPNTLQLADTRTGRSDTVTTSIGRSLHRVPGERRISFVKRVSAEESWIEMLHPESKVRERIVRMPPGVEDYAWTPDGKIVIGEGSVLKAYDPRRGGGSWETVADLSSSGVRTITRLAVSPDGRSIAVVAEPASR
jgi:WD40 repeat protein